MTPQQIIGILQDKLIAADWLKYGAKRQGKRVVFTAEEVKAVMDIESLEKHTDEMVQINYDRRT